MRSNFSAETSTPSLGSGILNLLAFNLVFALYSLKVNFRTSVFVETIGRKHLEPSLISSSIMGKEETSPLVGQY